MWAVGIGHPSRLILEGLAILLERDSRIDRVAVAHDAEAFLQLAPDVNVLVVVISQAPGSGFGPALLRRLPRELPLVLSCADADDTVLREGVRAGALGLLSGEASGDDLVEAVVAAAEGRVVMTPTVAAALSRQRPEIELVEPLTARQAEILALLAEGASNQDIAERLSISPKTAGAHVSSILAKLNVHSRGRAVAYALRAGIVVRD